MLLCVIAAVTLCGCYMCGFSAIQEQIEADLLCCLVGEESSFTASLICDRILLKL